MKILEFGNIPSWAGGRQENGLSNVIYQLSVYLSKIDNADVTLAATDFFSIEEKRDNLLILGWTKKILCRYIIAHPLLSVKIFMASLQSYLRYSPMVSLFNLFFKSVFLKYAIDRINPDIVHLHSTTALLYAYLVPKDCRLFITMHGLDGNNTEKKNYIVLNKMEDEICHLNNVSGIIFVTNRLISEFRDLYGSIKSPSYAILNAYDSTSFYRISPSKHNKLSICTIASISENKGQMRVLEGIKLSGLDIAYTCIGNDAQGMSAGLINYANTNNIDFKYLGTKTPAQIREILAGSDFMILPSSSEGFGLVFLESIACGIPVMLPRDLPIVKEQNIITAENSVLLDDCSSESIAAALLTLKPDMFRGEDVSKSVSGCSWENVADQYIKVFTQS